MIALSTYGGGGDCSPPAAGEAAGLAGTVGSGVGLPRGVFVGSGVGSGGKLISGVGLGVGRSVGHGRAIGPEPPDSGDGRMPPLASPPANGMHETEGVGLAQPPPPSRGPHERP